MKLVSLTLKNYRQHKDLHVDFTGNLIAVIGQNGAGKSNFLGSIQFALTGEQPGARRSDLLTWGETSGNVNLVFTHGDIEYALDRSLGTSAVSIRWSDDGGDKSVTGARAVTSMLDDIMGADKDLFKRLVFVKQAELDSILFDDPRSRELGFQKLLGLGEADKIYRELGDFITSNQTKDNFEESVDMTMRSMETMRANLSEAESNLKDITERKESLPDKQGIQDLLASENEKLANLKAIKSDMDRKAGHVRAVIDVRDQFDSLCNSISARAEIGTGCDFAKCDGRLRELDSEIASVTNLGKEMKRYAEAGSSLEEASRSFLGGSTYESMVSKIDGLRSRKSELESSLAHRAGEIQGLGKLDGGPGMRVCPICGRESDDGTDFHDVIMHLIGEDPESELKNMKAELDSVSGELKRLEDAMSYYNTQRSYSESVMNESERNLQELGKTMDNDIYTEIVSAVDPMMKARSVYNDLTSSKSGLVEDIRKAESMKNTIARHMDALDLAFEAYGTVSEKSLVDGSASFDDSIAESSSRVSELLGALKISDDINSEFVKFKTSVDIARKQISDAETLLETLRKRKDESDVINKKLDVLRTVRDWFHYSNGPHAMSKSVMTSLNEDVNSFLESFQSAFRVTPTEDGIGFLCKFVDGRSDASDGHDATFLSGGQKVQLAIAFRFATYKMFIGTLGLLSLDEPTAYLDDANVSRFGDLLTGISETARNMGVQVLIATHEKSVIPVCDQVITIGE